jgi:cytochrome c biogenesis protein CcmG/thiol:disulfide interchange protein DsbE
MECPQCHTQTRSGAHFCPGCGTDLSKASQPSPAAGPSPSVVPPPPPGSSQAPAGTPPHGSQSPQPPPGYGLPPLPTQAAPPQAKTTSRIGRILPWSLIFLAGLAIGLGAGLLIGGGLSGQGGKAGVADTPTPAVQTPPAGETAVAAPSVAPTPAAGVLAKERALDFTLKDLEDTEVSLSDSLGKVVVLTFWDTWDAASQEMMRQLQALQEAHADEENLAILAVNSGGSKETVADFAANQEITVRILLDTDKVQTGVYQVTNFPTTIVVDRGGVIASRTTGALEKDGLENLIDPLLSE